MSSRSKLILLLSFLIVAILWAIVASSDRDRSQLFVPSTYSPGPGGAKALYLMLEELGLPVSQLGAPFDKLDKQRGTLIAIEPDAVDFGDEEVARLKTWVRKGNRLVIFEGGERTRVKVPLYTALNKQKLLRSLKPQSLAARFGIKKKRTEDTSRHVAVVDSRRLEGVQRLNVSATDRWKESPETWTTWLADKYGPIVISRRVGKGEVIAISDASLVSNRFIQLEQNARLLPAVVLERGRPEEIVFDEYHHGHSFQKTIGAYFSSSVFGLLFVQAAIGCLLFFYSRRAVNVGRYRSLSRLKGRSSLEYVDSMANFFESAKADSTALEAILGRFLGRLARRTGIPTAKLDVNYLQKTGLRMPEGADPVALIRECREAIQANESSESMLTLAKKVAEMRSKLFTHARKEATWRRSK